MRKTPGYWNYERCKARAQAFRDKSIWRRCEFSSYQIAYRKGWPKDFFPDNKNRLTN